MARTEPTPLTAEQRRYIVDTAAAHRSAWKRVRDGLEKLGHGYGTRERRMVDNVMRVLSHAAPYGDKESLWRLPATPPAEPPVTLTAEQAAWIRHVCLNARSELEPVADYFAVVGWPDKALAWHVVESRKRLDVGLLVHACTSSMGGGHISVPAEDPAVWCGEGI